MSQPATRTRVVVAGGGITGLTTAYRLLADGAGGVDVTLLEQRSRLGGSLLTVRRDGIVFDGGPDAFVTAKPHATQLCRELGLGDKIQGTRPESRKVYFLKRGRLFHLPEGLVLAVPTRFWPLVTSPLFSLPAVLRMGLDLFARRRETDEDESIASFLERHLGREAVEMLGEPLLGGIYSGDPAQLSIKATFPQLVELEKKYGSLVRGALAMRAKAPKGPPPSAFHALEGGMATLVEALEGRIRELGGTIRTEVTLQAIAKTERGYALTIDPGGSPLEADELVLALPAPAVARLVEPLDAEAAAELRAVPHVSTATCLLAYARADIPHPMDAVGVLLPRSEGREASALTFMSSKWAGRAPDDTALMRVFFGGYARPQVRDMTDDELVALAREELRAVLGVTAPPRTHAVFRWNDCRPQPVVGHQQRIRRVRERLAEYPTLQLAGGPYDGVGIPDCVRQGAEAAKRVLARRTA